MVPIIAILGRLDLEDRHTGGRRKTLHNIVPESPPLQPSKTTYVMKEALSAPTYPYTSKKAVTTDERWELHNISL